ncbi:MAG: ABC transporter ATP-binding protein [Sulfolobales archaeon]|nr:ABC transporter ATP-binding protein [Sulfolobales archaeon]
MLSRAARKSERSSATIYEVLKLVLSNKGDVAVVALAIVVNSIALLISPYILGQIIDESIAKNKLDTLPQLVSLYLVTVFTQWTAMLVRTIKIESIGQRVLRDLRESLFSKYVKAKLDFHEEYQLGDLVSRVVNDTSAVNEAIVTGLLNVVGDIVSMSGSLVVMVYLSPQLTLVSLSTVPLMVFVARKLGVRLRRTWREVREKVSKMSTVVEENISGIEVIKSFGLEESAVVRFDRASREVYRSSLRASVLAGLFFPLMNISSSLSLAVVIAYGGYLCLSGVLSVGLLVAFTQYVSRLIAPINELVFMYDALQSALASLDRVIEVLKSEETESDEGVELRDVEGNISFENVWFEYEPGVPVLKDISFSIKSGEIVAIVGHTGAGKTTIANLLMKFYEPIKGRIKIDNIDIKEVKLSSLRKFISYIPQETYLFPGTVMENIKVVKPDASDEEVVGICEKLGIHRYISKLPNGYSTDVGEVGKRLSIGEKQLIAIARATLKSSRVVIFDEAFSSVDAETESVVKKALRELLRGRTGIIIAHRLSIARDCDRILVLSDGRVVEYGTFEELMEKQGAFYEMYRAQVEESTSSQ